MYDFIKIKEFKKILCKVLCKDSTYKLRAVLVEFVFYYLFSEFSLNKVIAAPSGITLKPDFS